MKRADFLSIVFAAFAIVAVITVTAQPQGGGQRQGGGQQGTPEEMATMMVERMSEQLDLSEKQEKQIYEINLEMMESRSSSSERPSREEMEAIHKKMDSKIKAVLTDEQADKYDEMEAKMRERGPRQ